MISHAREWSKRLPREWDGIGVDSARVRNLFPSSIPTALGSSEGILLKNQKGTSRIPAHPKSLFAGKRISPPPRAQTTPESSNLLGYSVRSRSRHDTVTDWVTRSFHAVACHCSVNGIE